MSITYSTMVLISDDGLIIRITLNKAGDDNLIAKVLYNLDRTLSITEPNPSICLLTIYLLNNFI